LNSRVKKKPVSWSELSLLRNDQALSGSAVAASSFPLYSFKTKPQLSRSPPDGCSLPRASARR
jgi:hypothetical protein